MATLTPILGLSKPIVGADDDVWGGMWNANADILDTLVRPVDLNPYLKLVGGTMTGPLILSGNAVAALGAVTLQQMQTADALKLNDAPNDGSYYARRNAGWEVAPGSAITTDAPSDGFAYGRRNAAWSKTLMLAGGTMTGDIVLKGDATAALNPVSLQQLNAKAGAYLPLVGGDIAGTPGNLGLGGWRAADLASGWIAAQGLATPSGLGLNAYWTSAAGWKVMGSTAAFSAALNFSTPTGALAYLVAPSAAAGAVPAFITALTITAKGNLIGYNVTPPGADVLQASWHCSNFSTTAGGVTGSNIYYGSGPAWKASGAGYGYLFWQDPNTGIVQLNSYPSAAAGAAFGGPYTWQFQRDGNFISPSHVTATGQLYAGTHVYCSGTLYINPANGWEWSFYLNGGDHIYAHRSQWYDHWSAATGNRTWYAPAGARMALDGSGNLTVYSGFIRNTGGRIISQTGGAASVSMYDTATGLAMGWYVDNNLCCATLDANGGVVTYLGSVNTGGNLAMVGAVTAGQQVISYGQRVISQGTGEPSLCMHRPGYFAAGFLLNGSSQIIVANMDGNGGWQATWGTWSSDFLSIPLDIYCGRNFSTPGGMFCATGVMSGYCYAAGHFVGGNGDTGTGIYRNDPGAARYIQMAPSWYWSWQTTTGDFWWYAYSNATWRMRNTDWLAWNPTGPVGGIGAYQNYSDRRGKRDIGPTEVGLPEVLKLRPVRFTRIMRAEDTIGRKFPDGRDMPDFIPRSEIGFVAQDVLEALPEAVVESANFEDGEARFSLTYDTITTALVGAVKTLNARLAKLEGRHT
jgi:Chaperone of endosialidase